MGAWLLLNPVGFPEPKDDSAWATRVMLGEEMWIAERPLDRAMVVNEAASMFGIGGVFGSLKRRPLPIVLRTVFEVALLPNTGLNNPLIEANLLNVASRPRCWDISRTGNMAP